MEHFGLIGEKLGHSLSVPIHAEVFRALRISADYKLFEIPKDGFEERVGELMRSLGGFNITIPYKQRIMPMLSRMTERAEAIGAVNTVNCAEKLGDNTDCIGFRDMLLVHGIDPAGKPCYVLGTGGASKCVQWVLREMGAEKVTVVSRNPSGNVIGYEQLAKEFSGVLVNTTPAGMYPNVTGCPVEESTLRGMMSRASGVCDLIYNPRETVLTGIARAMGVPACTGLTMLVSQALEADRLWLGREIDPGLVPKIEAMLDVG